MLAEGILARHPDRAGEDFSHARSKADKAMGRTCTRSRCSTTRRCSPAPTLDRRPPLEPSQRPAQRQPTILSRCAVRSAKQLVRVRAGPAPWQTVHGGALPPGRRRGTTSSRTSTTIPDKHLVFDGNDSQPTVRWDRYAFENVFVYSGDEGVLRSSRPAAEDVDDLQVAFCKAVLKKDIPPADPLKPSYRLDHLLQNDFPLPTDPVLTASRTHASRGCIVPRGGAGTSRSKADPRGDRNDIYRKMDRWLRARTCPSKAFRCPSDVLPALSTTVWVVSQR